MELIKDEINADDGLPKPTKKMIMKKEAVIASGVTKDLESI